MSNLPREIRKQAEEADAALASLRDQLDGKTEPEKQPEQVVQPVVQAPEPAKNDEWEHRYKVLEGKYRSEVPALSRSVNEAKETIASLQAQLNAMQKASEPKEEKKKDTRYDEVRGIYPEMSAIIESLERLESENAKLKSKLEAVDGVKESVDSLSTNVKAVQKTVAEKNYESFLSAISAKVADWQVINEGYSFHQWLTGRQPGSFDTRQEVLDKAAAVYNPEPVIEIFNAWKDYSGASKPKPKPDVMPARSGADSVPNDKKVYTQKEVDTFYDKIIKGHYRGKEAEVARIEAEFLAAEREGRLR